MVLVWALVITLAIVIMIIRNRLKKCTHGTQNTNPPDPPANTSQIPLVEFSTPPSSTCSPAPPTSTAPTPPNETTDTHPISSRTKSKSVKKL